MSVRQVEGCGYGTTSQTRYQRSPWYKRCEVKFTPLVNMKRTWTTLILEHQNIE